MKKPISDTTEERLFSLVDEHGEEIHGEELGLLLYKGGTVCDDFFSDNSATAICKNMGYTGQHMWTSEGEFSIQSTYKINLDNVKCINADWEDCSYSEEPNCQKNEDIFLSCISEEDIDEGFIY